MFRSFFTVGGFTLLSRILGFVRDKLIAVHLGGGAMADVWVAAFRFPNIFRRVFGEGAFNAAFVPMYGRRLEEEGEEAADSFARRTISLMATILITCFVISFIFMEPIVKYTNWGYAEDGRLEPAVMASRITVVYLIFICLVAAFSGILNSRRVFGAPAFAYVVLNLVFLAALLIVIPKTGQPLIVLSWSVVVSGILQLAVVVGVAIKKGVNLRPCLPRIDSDMKRLGILMAPGLLSAGVQQINLLVGQAVASFDVGGQASIYYADRIQQLPLGIIGMAGSVVLLTEITRNLRGGDDAGAKKCLNQGLEMSLLLSLPATVAMLVIPREIMYGIFEGGQFTKDAAITAGWVLMAFAPGVPAYVLAKVLQPGYFAREDTKTPMRFSIATALTNIVLVYPLFLWLGPVGCALATSIAGWVNVVLLWFGLRKANFMGIVSGFFSRVARILLASILMGAAVWGLARLVEPWLFGQENFFLRAGALVVLVIIGVVIYLIAVIATRVYSMAELKGKLRRRPQS
ncbi:MAG: murein biosynthesis integral membrane protein MurJ [Verrucomicrobiales bacterium]|nr:murein biosynthesis integral membrane protein MurJ [Verrucomicrobiales bacterium]